MLSVVKSLVKHSFIRWMLWKEYKDSVANVLSSVPREELWGCGRDDAGRLTVDSIPVTELSDTYDTPLHVVDKDKLISTYKDFVGSFRKFYPQVVLGTSYKTNPIPYVLKTLHEAGSYAEVISHFELWLALKIGTPPAEIIFNGPGKGDEGIKLAVEQEIRLINIDGRHEISKIQKYASKKGIDQAVGLRVITSVGWSSQFGLSIASGAAEAAFQEMLENDRIIPCGLHLHLGTGIQNIDTYVRAVSEVIDFSEVLYEKYGIKIEYFDFGGGFGVPTVRGISDWDARMIALGYPSRQANPSDNPSPLDYASALASMFERVKRLGERQNNTPLVILEPGRAITSSSQFLLLSVIGLKTEASKKIAIVDGGKNISMPLAWETHGILAATKMNAVHDVEYDVFGPLCHPGDIVVKNKQFPKLEEGDLLAIMDAGAYFIPNQMNFSNPRPAVVCVHKAEHFSVRRREAFDDIVKMDGLTE